ncbi:MAG: 2-C-methyl-D-erythritol 2,4-cyclodiphosphate synthase [Deltaproteobacteria bacterium]|nr:2-C-methyl-D-erythritol 2,4-cyclodiphosphate synthase [Deltaproteobacteria bacterium]
MRIGQGYDAHRLTDGRKLVLGGVTLPFERGLLGHSDADVLVHSICDALLGAAAMGDLGTHFPDTDDEYQGISSLDLLSRVNEMLERCGYRIGNIDATIIAERPRMIEFIPAMRENISITLGIYPSEVNIKATTTEGMGYTGKGEGIASIASALIQKTE